MALWPAALGAAVCAVLLAPAASAAADRGAEAPCGGFVDAGCDYGSGSICVLWAPVCWVSTGGTCNGALLEIGCQGPTHRCLVAVLGICP